MEDENDRSGNTGPTAPPHGFTRPAIRCQPAAAPRLESRGAKPPCRPEHRRRAACRIASDCQPRRTALYDSALADRHHGADSNTRNLP